MTRRRVLLYEPDVDSVQQAAAALAALDVDVVAVLDLTRDVVTSDADVLAVVVVERLPDPSSAAFVRRIRAENRLPVLLLAPRVEEDILLQELPTDLATPLVPMDLAQQIRSVVRRAPKRAMTFGPLTIDRLRRTVTVDNAPVALTPREFDLLAFMASTPGKAHSREELLAAVWQSSERWQGAGTVTEHVRRLRTKLASRPGLPCWLATVRGFGYRFDA